MFRVIKHTFPLWPASFALIFYVCLVVSRRFFATGNWSTEVVIVIAACWFALSSGAVSALGSALSQGYSRCGHFYLRDEETEGQSSHLALGSRGLQPLPSIHSNVLTNAIQIMIP